MPERQLQWLRRDLRRTILRMEADRDHLQEILDEIKLIEQEIAVRRRRFHVIQGGAAVVVMLAFASIGGILYDTAVAPVEKTRPPVVALPAPALTQPPSPAPTGVTPTPTPGTARPIADEETTGTQPSSRGPNVVLVREATPPRHDAEGLATAPPSTTSSKAPNTTTPTRPPDTSPATPPTSPPSTGRPPRHGHRHRCGGLHLALSPLVDICLFG